MIVYLNNCSHLTVTLIAVLEEALKTAANVAADGVGAGLVAVVQGGR